MYIQTAFISYSLFIRLQVLSTRSNTLLISKLHSFKISLSDRFNTKLTTPATLSILQKTYLSLIISHNSSSASDKLIFNKPANRDNDIFL